MSMVEMLITGKRMAVERGLRSEDIDDYGTELEWARISARRSSWEIWGMVG